MIRTLARPLLAAWFVYGGVRMVLEPQQRAGEVGPLIEPIASPLAERAGIQPLTQSKVEDLVRVHGAATAAVATVLAFSKAPRTAGVALTGLAAITVATASPFWRKPEGPERDAALEQFLKNLSLLGGAMLAAGVGHSAGTIKRKQARKVKAKAKAGVARKAKRQAAKKAGRAAIGFAVKRISSARRRSK